MRALQRLDVPTLLFVNKIDRAGADPERVLDEIEQRLTPNLVPMGSADGLGTRAAAFASFGAADGDLATRSRAGELHPVFFGSALTGAGVEEVKEGIAQLLPARAGDGDGPLSARVFKIERGPEGDRIAYTRLFSGAVNVRDRFDAGKVTAIRVFGDGDAVQRDAVQAGEIAKLWGLAEIQIGDWLGEPRRDVEHHFAPPTFESVVEPTDHADGAAASRRAQPARRAGPADRRPAGRHASGDLGLALRRGAAGGDRGDARERVRPRGRVPRGDDDLRRAPGRKRRGRRDPQHADQPVPRRPGTARRAGRAGVGVEVRVDDGVDPARCASLHLQEPRRLREAHGRVRAARARGGTPRLAGHRLRSHGDEDRLQPRRRPAVPARPDADRARPEEARRRSSSCRRSKQARLDGLRAGLPDRRRSADRGDRLDARRPRPPRCRSRDALGARRALGAGSDTCRRHGSRSYGASSRA